MNGYDRVLISSSHLGIFQELPDVILRKIEDEIKFLNQAEIYVSMWSSSMYSRSIQRHKFPVDYYVKKYRQMAKQVKYTERKQRLFDQYGDQI